MLDEPLLDPATEDRDDASDDDDDKIPPYSRGTEVKYFFSKGVPLGLSAILEWGAPPWIAMVMAGHTQQSADLQAALGYARVFFNITMLMTMFGMCTYYTTVLPGCIGANRKDRIAKYFTRSVCTITVLMIPMYALQFGAGAIMEGIGVQASIAAQVGTYCRLMIITGWLLMLELHIECTFVNLGYARCAMFNSLLTGLGVDVVTTYFFVYKLELGVVGVACAQMIVKACRILVWVILFFVLRLRSKIFVPPPKLVDGGPEATFSMKEFKILLGLAIPTIISFFTGWLIFELQLIAMAHVSGISQKALAAGAIWIQSESTLAAIQNGWLQATSMRTIALLGKRDRGAPKSFTILCVLSFLFVAVTNIPLVVFSQKIGPLVSNDKEVQEWFGKIVLVLVLHSQTRICSINATSLFIPMNKAVLSVAITVVSFYLVASPIAGVLALTDLVTKDVATKMGFCVGCTSVAQLLCATWGFGYLVRMDWAKAGDTIHERAMSDKVKKAGAKLGEGASSSLEEGDLDAAPPPPPPLLKRRSSQGSVASPELKPTINPPPS